MRCPGCEFVSSDLRDICPRCYIDLRPHKKLLGLKITNSKAPYDELLAKLLPGGARPKKKQSPAATKQPESKAAAPKPAKPAQSPAPPKAAKPEAPAQEIISQEPRRSFLSSFLSKFSKPAPKIADEITSPLPATRSDSTTLTDIIETPEAIKAAPTQVQVPPEPSESITPEPPKQPVAPTPPVMDFSDPQSDINQLLDSIYDQTELQIEAILAGKSDKAHTVETTAAAPPVNEEPTVEFEFVEETAGEVEVPVQEEVAEPSVEKEPDVLTEHVLGLPMLAPSSAPMVLNEVEADLLLPVKLSEVATPDNSYEKHIEDTQDFKDQQEPIAEYQADPEEVIEPQVPPIHVPEPKPAYQNIEQANEPLFPESRELVTPKQQPEYAFFDNPVPISASPLASIYEPAPTAAAEFESDSVTMLTEQTVEPLDDASQPEIAFEPDLGHQEISGEDVLAQISDALAEPDIAKTEPEYSDLPEQAEDDHRLNGHGGLSLAEPSIEPRISASPVDLSGAALSTLELSEFQIKEANAIFDLLAAQPWLDDHEVELFGSTLGVTTEKETMELLFDLSLKSLTDSNVQKILDVDIAKSETRHVTAVNLEQQLKRVEQQLSKQVVSLKGDPTARTGATEAPTAPAFTPQIASFRQRFVAIGCDLLLVVFLSAIVTTVRAMAEESLPVGTATWTDFYIDFAPHLASFIVAFLVLLPIYTIAILLITGNTLGGLISKIHILTSTGQEPNFANLILRGITLPASFAVPMLHLQDRVSHTFLSKDAYQLPVEEGL